MKWNQPKIKIATLLTILVMAFGVVIARTITRPQRVTLRSHIQICQKSEKGNWEKIDEVGPAVLNFEASLLEMKKGKKVQTEYVWQTKSKKGRSYSVKLLEPADISLNPVTGKFEAELTFEVSYDGKKAKVPGKLTTEALYSPLGGLKGKRAQGLFGQKRSSFTLVSANAFKPDGQKEPLMLVCKEEYRFLPKK